VCTVPVACKQHSATCSHWRRFPHQPLGITPQCLIQVRIDAALPVQTAARCAWAGCVSGWTRSHAEWLSLLVIVVFWPFCHHHRQCCTSCKQAGVHLCAQADISTCRAAAHSPCSAVMHCSAYSGGRRHCPCHHSCCGRSRARAFCTVLVWVFGSHSSVLVTACVDGHCFCLPWV
jgi:hypothetical protein